MGRVMGRVMGRGPDPVLYRTGHGTGHGTGPPKIMKKKKNFTKKKGRVVLKRTGSGENLRKKMFFT